MLPILAKHIRAEMNDICSTKSYSMLRDKHEALKHFSWETLWLEFQQKVPLLLKFLQLILPKGDKMFLSFVISLLLKKRCIHMSLMQRLVSVILYGSAARKQMFYCSF